VDETPTARQLIGSALLGINLSRVRLVSACCFADRMSFPAGGMEAMWRLIALLRAYLASPSGIRLERCRPDLLPW
jgi:hypothetical protein